MTPENKEKQVIIKRALRCCVSSQKSQAARWGCIALVGLLCLWKTGSAQPWRFASPALCSAFSYRGHSSNAEQLAALASPLLLLQFQPALLFFFFFKLTLQLLLAISEIKVSKQQNSTHLIVPGDMLPLSNTSCFHLGNSKLFDYKKKGFNVVNGRSNDNI